MPADSKHSANQAYWDQTAAHWKALRDRDGLWRRCPAEPDLAFDGGALDLIHHYAAPLAGKRACVIGSGDNYAALALAGMGARVVSVDISERQLEVAASRAATLGLDIEFVQADAADMKPLPDSQFDLACSTNGLFVWIAEPKRLFTEVHRILKPGGHYIFYDIHPFLRPWKDQIAPLEMDKPYAETGPFISLKNGQTIYEFSWRLSDLLNPLMESGLALRRLVESPPKDARFWQDNSYVPGDSSLLDWRRNPRAGLPVWLTVTAAKP